LTSLQDQVNRRFGETVTRGRTGNSDLATWATAGYLRDRAGIRAL